MRIPAMFRGTGRGKKALSGADAVAAVAKLVQAREMSTGKECRGVVIETWPSEAKIPFDLHPKEWPFLRMFIDGHQFIITASSCVPSEAGFELVDHDTDSSIVLCYDSDGKIICNRDGMRMVAELNVPRSKLKSVPQQQFIPLAEQILNSDDRFAKNASATTTGAAEATCE